MSKKKQIKKMPRNRSAAWRRNHYNKPSRAKRTAARAKAREPKEPTP